MDEDFNQNQQQNTNMAKKKLPLFNILIYFLVFLYVITVFISIKILSIKKPVVKDNEVAKTLIKKKRGKIAIIPIYGPIYKRESSFSLKGSDHIVELIRKYGEDENIKGIVLAINSPGGSVGAVQEIYSMILKIKQQYGKPFVAHFGDVAASGGYYIAVACDKIFSNKGTITGSIGVIFGSIEGEDLAKKIGIKANMVKSGKFKDIGSFWREMSKEERKLLEEMINDTYNSFIEAVAKGRNMSIEKVKEIADGRIFTGNQAVSLGLVDRVGDLYDAIDEAGVLAGIGKKPEVVRVRGQIFDEIFMGFESKLNLFDFLRDTKTPLLEYRMYF